MLTKLQKQQHIELGGQKIKESKTLVFADFTGVSTKDVNQLKAELKKAGATFKVIKKRLLKIALKDAGVDFDLSQFKAPIATIFAEQELTSVAAQVYKFGKDLAKKKINFKVVGGFDMENKALISAAGFLIIAKLPSREVLLAQIMGGFASPLRAFMFIVNELAKKTPIAAAPASAEATAGKPALG